MTANSEQLVLDLAVRPALGFEDFLISASNTAAVDIIDRWPNWPHWAIAVIGPAMSGKTHLANVWRMKSGADVVCAVDVDESAVTQLVSRRALVIENLEQGIGDETALFHVLNTARELGHSVLLTSRVAPGDLMVALPDLRSRLRALPVASIDNPDEHLLRCVLIKHFADRQLLVEPHIVAYIIRHMERSMYAAHEAVAEIDRLALQSHRRVTRALAAEVLKRNDDDGLEGAPEIAAQTTTEQRDR
jgi:chromosomal replication initiation ATPase DnaA